MNTLAQRIGLLSRTLLLVLFATGGCGDDGGGVDAGPNVCEAVNQCVGVADMMILESATPDGGGDPAPAILTACTDTGGPCNSVVFSGSDEEVIDCLNTCIGSSALAGLSTGCSSCYGCSVTCGRTQCVVPCLMATSTACSDCIQTNCTPAFDVCSGL